MHVYCLSAQLLSQYGLGRCGIELKRGASLVCFVASAPLNYPRCVSCNLLLLSYGSGTRRKRINTQVCGIIVIFRYLTHRTLTD